MVVC
jgi:putative transposase